MRFYVRSRVRGLNCDSRKLIRRTASHFKFKDQTDFQTRKKSIIPINTSFREGPYREKIHCKGVEWFFKKVCHVCGGIFGDLIF